MFLSICLQWMDHKHLQAHSIHASHFRSHEHFSVHPSGLKPHDDIHFSAGNGKVHIDIWDKWIYISVAICKETVRSEFSENRGKPRHIDITNLEKLRKEGIRDKGKDGQELLYVTHGVQSLEMYSGVSWLQHKLVLINRWRNPVCLRWQYTKLTWAAITVTTNARLANLRPSSRAIIMAPWFTRWINRNKRCSWMQEHVTQLRRCWPINFGVVGGPKTACVMWDHQISIRKWRKGKPNISTNRSQPMLWIFRIDPGKRFIDFVF